MGTRMDEIKYAAFWDELEKIAKLPGMLDSIINKSRGIAEKAKPGTEIFQELRKKTHPVSLPEILSPTRVAKSPFGF